MLKIIRPSEFVRRSLALALVLGAGVLAAGAQAVDSGQASAPVSMQTQPAQLLDKAPAMDTSKDPVFSSSVALEDDAPAAVASLHPTTLNFMDPMQYGGGQRRRYGNPRYRGGNTNADGSSKYIFFGGGGLSQPVGNTWHYLTPSYGIQVGGGRQFSKKFAVPIQFDYDHFGFTGQTLGNQQNLYNYLGGSVTGLDGTSHVWSFSVDPTFTFYQSESWGAYAAVGAGFYHKTANFTVPAVGEYCDPYYGCYEYSANQSIDKYTSNAPGFNAGFGLTYKFSRFANERFYGEVRYVFVDNSKRAGFTLANEGSITSSSTNFYPANSNHTTYFPIKFGIRF
jgi:hypothetical protein